MADKEKEGLFEDICEGVGGGLGAVTGAVAGVVRGAASAISNGDPSKFSEKWEETVDSCVEEGSRIGRKYMPGAAVGLATTVLIGLTGGKVRR